MLVHTMKRLSACLVLALLAPAAAASSDPGATAAAPRPCKPIVNPYEGTRYEGSDLYRIRATKVSCRTARRVVRKGHHKALGGTPDAYGFVRVTYRRWRITGDLRGDHDRYVARAADGKRVTWLF
jgi:hypothetical protein